MTGRVVRLVIPHKDRLLRCGVALVTIYEANHVEIVILQQCEDAPFVEEWAQDVLEIITVFSARLYGSRSRKNQKLLDGMKLLALTLCHHFGSLGCHQIRGTLGRKNWAEAA